MAPAVIDFARVAKHFHAGTMPVAGGLLDQPQVILEALDFYDGLT